MKKLFLILILFLLFPLTASAKPIVVTTIPDLAALTQEVGKDLVEVRTLAKGNQDPHFLEPKPSYAVVLNRADLLISVGLDLESGWLPVLLTQARNPKIQPHQPGHLEAFEGLRILEIPTGPIDRSHGDVHPEGNPHYWMDPRNGLVIANTIANRLAKLDPQNSASYQNNFLEFQKRFSEKIKTWEADLVPIRGKSIIAYHRSFSYFTDWAGLNVMGYIEPKPGIPPAPAHVLSLIQQVKQNKIPLAITENYYDPKPAQQLAEKTSIKVLHLPASVGGEPTIKTYEQLFEVLVSRLKGSL